MFDYEGNLVEVNQQQHHLMESEDNSVDDFEVSHVSTPLQWDEATDSKMASIYSADCYDDNSSCLDDSVLDLAKLLSLQAEVSKFGISIGSCVASPNCPIADTLFNDTFNTSLDELEDYFSKDLLPKTNITVNQPKGVSKTILSKPWTINEKLAQGIIDNTTNDQM